jgi:NAD(P)H dehydrogenase (quinone)
MIRALVLYCHPSPESFTAAVRDVVLAKLRAAGAEVRLRDLYTQGFQPVLSRTELQDYPDRQRNRAPVEAEVADLLWCDTLIFIYPTWWYGMPALLKGWLDRVLLPGVAFDLPDRAGGSIRPGLRHISRLGVFTTCGASRLVTWFAGASGKHVLLRGVGLLLDRRRRQVFVALYRMDASTLESRQRHLRRIATRMERLIGRQGAGPIVQSDLTTDRQAPESR